MPYDDALEDDERDLTTGRAEHDDEDDGDDEHEDHGGDEGRKEGEHGDDEDQGEDSAEERRRARAEQRRQDKERRRKARERDQQLLRQQAQELADLRAMVSGIAQRTDMGQLETHIAQAGDAYRQAAHKLRTAKESGDVEAELAAQEEWYGARKRVDDLAALMERASQQGRPPQQPARPQVNAAKLTAFQETFFDDHPWFDKNLRDEDSRAAAALSDRIAGEGYAPDTVEHWRELRARLREQMPHHFGAKPAAQRQSARSPVSGSGGSRAAQPGGNADERRIPRAYREMLEQTGDWHDPKRRKAMVDEYFASAKRHGV